MTNKKLQREKFAKGFSSERERAVFPWQRANILCSCSYVFGTSLMKVNTHALTRREEYQDNTINFKRASQIVIKSRRIPLYPIAPDS